MLARPVKDTDLLLLGSAHSAPWARPFLLLPFLKRLVPRLSIYTIPFPGPDCLVGRPSDAVSLSGPPPVRRQCADPSNSKSVSFTGRASITSSIVREHDFLGAYLNHMEVVYVHRQEDTQKLT